MEKLLSIHFPRFPEPRASKNRGKKARRPKSAYARAALRRLAWKANCCDNARMESFRATLKTELTDGQVYATRAEAKSALFRYIEIFCNRQRLHGARGYHSPADFEHSPN